MTPVRSLGSVQATAGMRLKFEGFTSLPRPSVLVFLLLATFDFWVFLNDSGYVRKSSPCFEGRCRQARP